MIDKEMAKLDPSSVFHQPREVLTNNELSRKEKIDILRRWGYDEREMSVAEEENMRSETDDQNNVLDEINKCLLELGVDSSDEGHPPTKQG
jgi:L-ribulose-5-phosphate 3-epimerase UlaE